MKHGFYVEVEPIIMKFLKEKDIHIFYFCGGRGTGKTYGALDFCRKLAQGEILLDPTDATNKFLYLRRTGVEAASVATPEACPFKKYNKEEGYEICADFSTKLGFGNFYMDTEKTQHIGYCAALSTFANLRGVDFTDVNFILYDECIPENKNKHPLKEEGFLFLNMLETINRNRALEGKQEIVVCLLSNPIDLGSALLAQLNLTGILNAMIFKNQEKFTDPSRSLHIEKYKNHPVSQAKANSNIYKFGAGTGFNERSLSGDFVDNDLELVKKVYLTEYSAYLSLEDIYVYKHKSNGTFHICQIATPPKYAFKAVEREKVRALFYWLYKMLIIERRVTYDNYITKVNFDQMIGYKPSI